jgi:hypothetical protein
MVAGHPLSADLQLDGSGGGSGDRAAAAGAAASKKKKRKKKRTKSATVVAPTMHDIPGLLPVEPKARTPVPTGLSPFSSAPNAADAAGGGGGGKAEERWEKVVVEEEQWEEVETAEQKAVGGHDWLQQHGPLFHFLLDTHVICSLLLLAGSLAPWPSVRLVCWVHSLTRQAFARPWLVHSLSP